jgi:hypothetical protein
LRFGAPDVIGWIIYGILMLLYLEQDFIHRARLVLKAAALRSHVLFFSGSVIIFISATAVWISVLYSNATASSNADLVINAVILLFVVNIDEQVFTIVSVSLPNWIIQLSQQEEQFSISRETHIWVSISNASVVIQSATSMQDTNEEALESLSNGDEDALEQTYVSATTDEETSSTGDVMQNQIQPQSQDEENGTITTDNNAQALE